MDTKKEEEIISDLIKTSTTSSNNADLTLDELIEKVNTLSKNKNPYSISKEIEELKSVFYSKLKTTKKPEKEINDNELKKLTPNPIEEKFKVIYAKYKKLKLALRREKEQQEIKNLAVKNQIITNIDKLTQEDESIKKTFERFRILQNQWRDTGSVPQTNNSNIWQSYHHHVELFYDYIKINKDLRDLDFKRNLEEKTEICEKAEALKEIKSLNQIHYNLQELHEHWKNVGPVKRELREKLWERFQNITKILNKNRNDYFLEIKEKDNEKLIRKDNISKKINALTKKDLVSHKEWQLATSQIIELEIKWKSIGRLNKINNALAWKNLRVSLNNFYEKRNIFYKEKKEKQSNTLKLKTEICEKAEALQSSKEWKETSNKLIKLQTDWKEIGFLPQKQSNKLWKRFKVACDIFFNAKKTHYKAQDKRKEACLKEKQELLKETKSFKSTNAKAGIKQLKDLNDKWGRIGDVPKNKITINEEFFNLINSKLKTLGLNKEELDSEQYKNKISSLKGNKKTLSNEKQLLLKKIDTLKKETAQYENNISFLAENKGTNALKKNVEKQIATTSNKIETLKKRLQLLSK